MWLLFISQVSQHEHEEAAEWVTLLLLELLFCSKPKEEDFKVIYKYGASEKKSNRRKVKDQMYKLPVKRLDKGLIKYGLYGKVKVWIAD